jgi:hypothetical protein
MDELEPEGEWKPPKRQGGLIAAIVLALGAGVAAGAWWYLREQAQVSPQAAAPAVDAGEVAAPAADAGAVSPADGDALLRKLAAEASSSPELLRWVAAPNIVQRIAAAVRLVASGASPRPVLTFIEIEGPFAVQEKVQTKLGPHHKKTPDYSTERDFASAQSYARYDGVTKIVTSIDPAIAGRAYGQLRPYFDAAFAEVATSGEHFDDVLAAALRRIVKLDVPAGPVELVQKGALYLYKDPALESKSAAEKHLLRMGPKNGKAIQDLFRRFAESAGVKL